jgi:hypothetical protein
MLFDLLKDPHEQENLAEKKPDLVNQAMRYLTDWQSDVMRTATHPTDPMWYVIKEGGPLHTRDNVKTYIHRLIQTGREEQAEILQLNHPEVAALTNSSDSNEESYDIPDMV